MFFTSNVIVQVPFSLESLATLLKWTHIWAFPGVYPHMGYEVPGLTERLWAFTTSIRPLASVLPNVHFQRIRSHEPLFANRAYKRPFV